MNEPEEDPEREPALIVIFLITGIIFALCYCAILIVRAVQEKNSAPAPVVKTITGAQSNLNRDGSVSASEYGITPLGISREELTTRFGEPVSEAARRERRCIAYLRQPVLGQQPGQLLDNENAVYTFCFWKGVLDHKRQEQWVSLSDRDFRPYPAP